MHLKHRWACHGSLSATKNTWMADSKNISKTLNLLFCWLNKISVTTAAAATECSPNTAVDHYSMAWEVCEVVILMKSRLGALVVQGLKSRSTSVSSWNRNTTRAGVCSQVWSHCLAFMSVALIWDSTSRCVIGVWVSHGYCSTGAGKYRYTCRVWVAKMTYLHNPNADIFLACLICKYI